MRSFRALVGASWPLALVLSLTGCGDAAAEAQAGATGGAGGSAGQTNLPASLSFASETLTMVPGEARDVSVVATPPDRYAIRFALLGDFQDASLDRGEVVTGDDGRATVRLTAPTNPTTFSLRASVGDSVATQAGVSVSASGFATLQVEPSYAGKRPITYWLASVRAGTSCAKLVGNPEDGDLKGGAPSGQYPQVEGVPVGPPLAVTLRAGFYLSGCKDVSELSAGAINKLVIPVNDVPIKVDETNLGVTLTLDPPVVAWKKTLGVAASEVSGALVGGDGDDVGALLASMQAATPSSAEAQAFQSAATAGAWGGALTTTLGGPLKAPTALRQAVLAWLLDGTGALAGGKLEAQLVSSPKAPGQAFLELESIAGIDALAAGLPSTNLASWKGEPGDTVLLGTTLFAMPSRLLTALAEPQIIAQAGAGPVADAMAQLIGCDAIAATLVSQGMAPGQSYSGCSLACTKALCTTAVEALWTRVRDASAKPTAPKASLQVSATATASVDEQARPADFKGSWVGSLVVGSTSISVGGPTTGGPPTPPM